MSGIFLTQSEVFIIGPVAKLLGYIMEAIFYVLDLLNIPNVGLAIILFTIVVYLLLMPITIKQQKFSKLSNKMNPELQAIKDKYKDKKDQDSIMAMNAETQQIYAKYGVSPIGSCLPLLIQFPIILALFQVMNNIPAYVGKVKEVFMPLVNELITKGDTAVNTLKEFSSASAYGQALSREGFLESSTEVIQNTYIDVLNRASTAEFNSLAETFPELSNIVTESAEQLNKFNTFLGLNMADSPSFMVSEGLANGQYLLIVGALLIPLLSALTQWINSKLLPTNSSNDNNKNKNSGNEMADSMAASMKTMNYIMPVMSAFFCYTMPAGLGLYWIAGAIVRSIQQVIVNKHIDKIDIDELTKKNVEKRNKRLEKAGIDPNNLNTYASMNTRNYANKKYDEEAIDKAKNYYNSGNYKEGSIAAKANMVKKYNEKNK